MSNMFSDATIYIVSPHVVRKHCKTNIGRQEKSYDRIKIKHTHLVPEMPQVNNIISRSKAYGQQLVKNET